MQIKGKHVLGTMLLLVAASSFIQAQSGTCSNLVSTFNCSSNGIQYYFQGAFNCCSGYVQASGGGICVDINECSSNGGLGPCQQNCTNTPGSFYCSCYPGYIQSGYYCSDINECSPNGGLSPCQQNCNNTRGSFYCSCYPGYMYMQNENSCNDINECLQNPCQNCTNTMGSFLCSCNSGYALAADGINCNDINECSPNAGLGPCQQNCTNTPGSFYCSCYPGYMQSENYCYDINECASNNGLGTCQQNCTNTPGSYYCGCYPGYTLAVDNQHCNDTNECTAYGGLGPCQHECINTVGSFYCKCNSGYALQSNGYNCSDIDECSTNEGLGPCDQICVNEPGSFYCDCQDSYVLTDKQHSYLDGWCNSTQVANVCLPCPCQNAGTCQKCDRNESVHLTAICQCSGDYTGYYCEAIEMRVLLPSIVTPLALIVTIVIVFIVIFCTKRFQQKDFVMTKNTIYEMVNLQTKTQLTSKEGLDKGHVTDMCNQVVQDTIQAEEMGVRPNTIPSEHDIVPVIPERKYLDEDTTPDCRLQDIAPPIPERKYDVNIFETSPPLPERMYSTDDDELAKLHLPELPANKASMSA